MVKFTLTEHRKTRVNIAVDQRHLNEGLTVVTPAIRRLAAVIVCLVWPKEPTYVDKLPLPTRDLLIKTIVFYANICFEIDNKREPGR